MRQSRLIMGMPVFLEIVEENISMLEYEDIFNYFVSVDKRFSTYKPESELSRINRGELRKNSYSEEMKEVLRLAYEMQRLTNGYFNIVTPEGTLDPSGLVKGWALRNAAKLLKERGYKNFYVEIGGDIQVNGRNTEGNPWSIGIRNPFNRDELVKVIYPQGKGVATSGDYIRGAHIYDPLTGERPNRFVSLTVIGSDVYEADCFATAAFAMGEKGMEFLESRNGFEAYAIDAHGVAVMTNGFPVYTHP